MVATPGESGLEDPAIDGNEGGFSFETFDESLEKAIAREVGDAKPGQRGEHHGIGGLDCASLAGEIGGWDFEAADAAWGWGFDIGEGVAEDQPAGGDGFGVTLVGRAIHAHENVGVVHIGGSDGAAANDDGTGRGAAALFGSVGGEPRSMAAEEAAGFRGDDAEAQNALAAKASEFEAHLRDCLLYTSPSPRDS